MIERAFCQQPGIIWNQPVSIKKDIYRFSKISDSDSLLQFSATGARNTCLIEVKKNDSLTLSVHTFPKNTKNRNIWFGLIGSRYAEIYENINTLVQSSLELHLTNPDTTIKLAEYRKNLDEATRLRIVNDNNTLYMAVDCDVKASDSSLMLLIGIDSTLAISKDSVYLPYSDKLIELETLVIQDSAAMLLLKCYNINAVEKRKQTRNYTYIRLKFMLLNKNAVIDTIPLRYKTYYHNIRIFSKSQLICGLYGSVKNNRATGIFLYDLGSGNANHIPFPDSIVGKFKKSRFFHNKRVYNLYPDLLVDHQKKKILLMEQYYAEVTGSSSTRLSYDYHFDHVLKYTTDNTSAGSFDVLNKRQYSYNDFGEQSSYNIIWVGGKPYLIFGGYKNYLKKPFAKRNLQRLNRIYLVELENFNQKRIIRANKDLTFIPTLISKLEAANYLLISYQNGQIFTGKLTF